MSKWAGDVDAVGPLGVFENAKIWERTPTIRSKSGLDAVKKVFFFGAGVLCPGEWGVLVKIEKNKKESKKKKT